MTENIVGPGSVPAAAAIALDPAADSPALWVGTRGGAVFFTNGRWLHGFPAFPGTAVRALALSANGASVLAAGAAGEVSVRRADGEPEDAFTLPRPVIQAAIVASRTYVVVDDRRGGFVVSPDSPDGALAAVPIRGDGTSPVSFDAFGAAPGGERLTLLSALEWMRWRRADNAVEGVREPVPGRALMYMDGLVGLSASGGHYFLHWDDCLVFETETGAPAGECPIVPGASAAALSDDGRVLAVGGRGGELVVMTTAGVRLASLAPTREEIRQVVVDRAGSVAGWLDLEGAFGLVDVAAGAEIVTRAISLRALAQVHRRFGPPDPR